MKSLYLLAFAVTVLLTNCKSIMKATQTKLENENPHSPNENVQNPLTGDENGTSEGVSNPVKDSTNLGGVIFMLPDVLDPANSQDLKETETITQPNTENSGLTVPNG